MSSYMFTPSPCWGHLLSKFRLRFAHSSSVDQDFNTHLRPSVPRLEFSHFFISDCMTLFYPYLIIQRRLLINNKRLFGSNNGDFTVKFSKPLSSIVPLWSRGVAPESAIWRSKFQIRRREMFVFQDEWKHFRNQMLINLSSTLISCYPPIYTKR